MLAIHITLAFASAIGFLLRLGWSYSDPDMLQKKFVRVAPHVVDTFLLIAGLVLFFSLPDDSPVSWLVAKMIGLVAYIGFGVMALRGEGTRKLIGMVGAAMAVSYIFAVAYTRQPLIF